MKDEGEKGDARALICMMHTPQSREPVRVRLTSEHDTEICPRHVHAEQQTTSGRKQAKQQQSQQLCKGTSSSSTSLPKFTNKSRQRKIVLASAKRQDKESDKPDKHLK
jgi:hypothetical protein